MGDKYGINDISKSIFYYHNIQLTETDCFRAQIETTMENTNLVSLENLVSGKCPEPAVAITFDDAFSELLETALPILDRLHVPYAIFAPTGCLGLEAPWLRDHGLTLPPPRVMSKNDLRKLSENPLVTIGSHGIHHKDLKKLSDEDLNEEMGRSRTILEKIIRRPVTYFSFPYGSHGPREVASARNAGYRRVLGISPHLYSGPVGDYLLGRQKINPDDWRIEHILKLNGCYGRAALALSGILEKVRRLDDDAK